MNRQVSIESKGDLLTEAYKTCKIQPCEDYHAFRTLSKTDKLDIYKACTNKIFPSKYFAEEDLFCGYTLPIHCLAFEAYYGYITWCEFETNVRKFPKIVAEFALNEADGHEGWVPLHFLADCGMPLDVARFLGDICSNPIAARDIKGQTPIHFAANNGHEGMLELLVETLPIGLHVVDDEGEMPFDRAANEYTRAAIMRGLIKGCCHRSVPRINAKTMHPFRVMMLEAVKENCTWEDIDEVLNNMPNNRTFLSYALGRDYSRNDRLVYLAVANRAPTRTILAFTKLTDGDVYFKKPKFPTWGGGGTFSLSNINV